jgi:hypothetical protein
MVVETRGGTDPGKERVRRLRDALEVVAAGLAGKSQISRKLANALYGLSFHMSETLGHWKSVPWDEEYSEVLELIEEIFEGDETE